MQQNGGSVGPIPAAPLKTIQYYLDTKPDLFKERRKANILDLSDLNLESLKGLENVPHIGLIRTLILKNNKIRHINPGELTSLKKVSFLSLKNNRLQKIDSNTFNLSDLANLDLSKNNIKEIAPKAFFGSKNLTELNLDSNELEELHPHAFDGLENVKYLAIRKNPFVEINSDSLSSLTSLITVFTSKLPAGVLNMQEVNEKRTEKLKKELKTIVDKIIQSEEPETPKAKL